MEMIFLVIIDKLQLQQKKYSNQSLKKNFGIKKRCIYYKKDLLKLEKVKHLKVIYITYEGIKKHKDYFFLMSLLVYLNIFSTSQIIQYIQHI